MFGSRCTHLASSVPGSFAGTTTAKIALPGRQILESLSTLEVVETVEVRFDELTFGMCVRVIMLSTLLIDPMCDMVCHACSYVLGSVLNCVSGGRLVHNRLFVAKNREIYTRRTRAF